MRDTHDHTKIHMICLFCITSNSCECCLLTPSAIVALPKCIFKGWCLLIRGFISLRSGSRHNNIIIEIIQYRTKVSK